MNPEASLEDRDADRLELLDRIEQRMPEVKLDEHLIEWTQLPDGAEALVLDGGGFTPESTGCFIAAAGDDLHVVGPTAPIIPGCIGCVVVSPDGTRRLARVVDDPAALDS